MPATDTFPFSSPHTGGSWPNISLAAIPPRKTEVVGVAAARCPAPAAWSAIALSHRTSELVVASCRGLTGVGRTEDEALRDLADKLFDRGEDD